MACPARSDNRDVGRLVSWHFGKSIPRKARSALTYFSAHCWPWNAAVSPRLSLPVQHPTGSYPLRRALEGSSSCEANAASARRQSVPLRGGEGGRGTWVLRLLTAAAAWEPRERGEWRKGQAPPRPPERLCALVRLANVCAGPAPKPQSDGRCERDPPVARWRMSFTMASRPAPSATEPVFGRIDTRRGRRVARSQKRERTRGERFQRRGASGDRPRPSRSQFRRR